MNRKIITPKDLAEPLGAYSYAFQVKASEWLYVAGQLSVDGTGKAVGIGDFKAQVRQVFENMGRVLAAADQDYSSVVKFTTYLVDSENISDFYEVRAEIFRELYPDDNPPPNTLLIVNRLVKQEFLIELEAVAAIR